MSDEYRVVPCEHCDSGHIERGHPNAPYPSSVDVCPFCNGGGEYLVSVSPISLDDIDALDEMEKAA